METKQQWSLITLSLLVLYLCISVLINIFLSAGPKILISLAELVFFSAATSYLVYRWRMKGLVTVLILLSFPYLLMTLAVLFEHGIAWAFFIFTQSIIYQVKVYAIIGIMIGLVIGLSLSRFKGNERILRGTEWR